MRRLQLMALSVDTLKLDSLESCFQEEVKLDPDRKMKLASELGLQPRQIAVWFQNRRARWKAKQLERLYDTLKQEYDVVSREKHKLQDEVSALKAMLKEQPSKNQVSTGCTEISGIEETVESTSVGNRSSGKPAGGTSHLQMAKGSYVFNVDDYSSVIAPADWGLFLICGFACFVALAIYFFQIMRKFYSTAQADSIANGEGSSKQSKRENKKRKMESDREDELEINAGR